MLFFPIIHCVVNSVFTLAAPIARNFADPVWLYKNSSGNTILYGMKPDIGAFVAACLSCMPGWMRFLLWIRAGFVRLLGMRQDKIPKATRVNPEDVSYTIMIWAMIRYAVK
jgi:hypothetical protein